MVHAASRHLLLLLAACLALRGRAAAGSDGVAVPKPPSIPHLDDLNVNGSCKAALVRYCSHVLPGNRQKAHCLRDQAKAASERKEHGLSPVCALELAAWFVQAARAGKPVVQGFKDACAEDLEKYCKGVAPNKTTECLKTQGRKGMLTESCNKSMFKLQRWQAANIQLDLGLWMACHQDMNRIPECKALNNSVEPGVKKSCLLKHRTSLSGPCQEKLAVRQRDDAKDIRLNQKAFGICRPQITKFCGDEKYGEARVLKCLWDKQDEDGFSESCKKEVVRLTNHSLSDYRFDYRIRTRCQHAIDTLCATQKAFVDKLPIAELFGKNWQEGKSGQVIQCLKGHYDQIGEDSCKKEMNRIIKIHAVNPFISPVIHRNCQEDVDRFCKKVPAASQNLCLRQHLDRLSPACKNSTLVQGALQSRDIHLNPVLDRLCRPAVKQYCGDVQHGEGQVMECLAKHMNDADFNSRCKSAVQNNLMSNNRDWRLKFGIHEKCQIEAKRLCADKIPTAGGAVLVCLKANVSKIQDEGCRHEVDQLIAQGANNIKLAVGTYSACVDDVKKICPSVTPGLGRVHSCLLHKRKNLSQPCKEAEFQEQRVIAEDLMRHPLARKACKSSLHELCPDAPEVPGAKWACLGLKKDSPKMADACREVVEAHEKMTNYEFHLNPELSKHCAKDADRLCFFEVALANYKDFSSEGAVIGCLIKQKGKITDLACSAGIVKKELQRVQNIFNDPETAKACQSDIMTFCKDVRPGHSGYQVIHKCLQDHMEKLSSDCKAAEHAHLKRQFADVRLQTDIKKMCTTATKKFCNGVVAGKGRVLDCLLENMFHDGMDSDCRDLLKTKQAMLAKHIDFNSHLAQTCKADLALLKNEGPQLETPGADIDRLISHRTRVKSLECLEDIHKTMARQSNDVSAKPNMVEACSQDMKSLCHEVADGAGRMHACLRKHLFNLQSERCKSMVKEVWRWESERILLNPMVQQSCGNEMSTFCPKIEDRNSQALVCLWLHATDQGFGSACSSALESLREAASSVVKNTTASLRLPIANTSLSHIKELAAALAQEKGNEFISYMKAHRGFWDTWGVRILGLLVVSCGAIGLLLMRARRKTVYDIEVAQDANEPAPQKYPA
eukprot:TRINITY_DN60339_c0_g1_i1.p1 TRINITY_DN60339_c0_g1~~TRINITY_DN60339_c0_g1_i1.p1  ORF type:complete len:1121 (-),score=198.98 TRINITY_DN60339_c0_g1_i1:202-3564(-)